MATGNVDEIKVRLNGIEELFSEPEADPFDPDSRYWTGLEELLEQMHGLRSKELRVVIELPPETLKSDLQKKTEAALRRYCRAKVVELKRLLKDHWHLARHQLFTAVMVLVGFFLAASLIVVSEMVTGILEALAVFGLGVLAIPRSGDLLT